MVDHLTLLGAACAEPGHVVDRQGRLDAESASKSGTWAGLSIEPRHVVAHLTPLGAACIELKYVVAHQASLDATCAEIVHVIG